MSSVTVDDATDAEGVKSSLRRLAGPDDREVIERATAALEDLDSAVAFVETTGLDALESAVEATVDPELEIRGKRALDRFRRFRRAAAGEHSDDHFHRGHGTDLRGDDESPTR